MINVTNLSARLKQNWFKLAIGILLLFLIVKKDFTFQFNLNTPDKAEMPTKGVVPPSQAKKDRPSALTDNQTSVNANQITELGVIPFVSSTPKFNIQEKLSQIDEKTKQAYLKRFAHVAISERKKYGVPSSITLANALIHSFAGTRDMAASSNNHFAIACSDNWTGSSATYQDACYRQYENAWTSFRDHSQHITTDKYSHLKGLGSNNYEAWANALEKAGFSDFDNLSETLLKIISQYKLSELDTKN